MLTFWALLKINFLKPFFKAESFDLWESGTFLRHVFEPLRALTTQDMRIYLLRPEISPKAETLRSITEMELTYGHLEHVMHGKLLILYYICLYIK
jgi:hypothetical protein